MKEKLQVYRKKLGKNRTLCAISEKLCINSGSEDECVKIASAYVTAPVMCGYMLWVLGEAWRGGIKRLYFLARDGWSMYEMGKVLCKKLRLPIECRYLYSSRYAWRQAEYHLSKEEGLNAVCLGGIDVSFGRIMARAGLSHEEGREIARLLHKEEGYENRLSHGEIKKLRFMLESCEPFMERMDAHSREAYPNACGYLKQEGLMDKITWALVDSGWTGSMQKTLRNLLNTMGYEGKTEGYYFGMYEYPPGAEPKTYHSWYFKPMGGLRRKVFFSNSLFECIFSSPEGMTVGYERKDGRYRPVLEKEWNPNREKVIKTARYLMWYAEELGEKLAEELTENFIFMEGKQNIRVRRQNRKIQKIVFVLLRNFMTKPNLKEAEEFGAYIFCDDIIGEEAQRAAAPLTSAEIKENRFLRKTISLIGKKGPPVRESAWMEGSIVLSGMADRELWHCAVCKYIRYLRKMLVNL